MEERPIISMIAAIGAKTRAIGKGNALLWKIPEDLERFRDITKGHPVIMGRKTLDSMGRPLPERTNIVITRDAHFEREGCIPSASLEDALNKARLLGCKEIFVIGGGQIYEEAIAFADKLYLTLIESEVEGDSFFPDYSEFTKVLQKKGGDWNGFHYTFTELERA